MELNREQIIKALECCIIESNCTGCPLHHQYETDCLKYAGEKALSLIKELIAENERLKASRYMAHPDGKLEMIPSIESVRTDTVNKMRDMILKESTIIDGMDHCYCLTYEQICLIAKRAIDEDHEKANK